MIKGSFNKFIVVSMLVHIALILALSQLNTTPAHFQNTPKPQPVAIKSFLYSPPAPVQPPATISTPEDIKVEKEKSVPIIKAEPIDKKEAVTPTPSEVTVPTVAEIPDKRVDKEQTKKITPQNTSKKEFSAYSGLQNLRNSINKQVGKNTYSSQNNRQAPSVFNPNATLVPHVQKVLTPDEKKQQNTTTLSKDIAITKLDNGMCSITQDLSNVGMEKHKAVSYFACGESAFDSAFREHMKKVRDKHQR